MPAVEVLMEGPIAAGPLSAFPVLAMLAVALFRRLFLLALLPSQRFFVPIFSRAENLGGRYSGCNRHSHSLRHHLPIRSHASGGGPGFRIHKGGHFRLFVRCYHFLVRDNVRHTVPVDCRLAPIFGLLLLLLLCLRRGRRDRRCV